MIEDLVKPTALKQVVKAFYATKYRKHTLQARGIFS